MAKNSAEMQFCLKFENGGTWGVHWWEIGKLESAVWTEKGGHDHGTYPYHLPKVVPPPPPGTVSDFTHWLVHLINWTIYHPRCIRFTKWLVYLINITKYHQCRYQFWDLCACLITQITAFRILRLMGLPDYTAFRIYCEIKSFLTI